MRPVAGTITFCLRISSSRYLRPEVAAQRYHQGADSHTQCGRVATKLCQSDPKALPSCKLRAANPLHCAAFSCVFASVLPSSQISASVTWAVTSPCWAASRYNFIASENWKHCKYLNDVSFYVQICGVDVLSIGKGLLM
jgi:hypothetical protein